MKPIELEGPIIQEEANQYQTYENWDFERI